MSKNTTLYYLAVFSLALTAPWLVKTFVSRDASAVSASASNSKTNTVHAAVSAAAAPSAGSSNAGYAVWTPQAPPSERALKIETPEYIALVSSLNGGLKSFVLKDPQFREKNGPADIVSTDKSSYYPLSFKVAGAQLGDYPAWEVEDLDGHGVRMSTQADGLAIARKLEPGKGPYQLWITTRLQNTGNSPRKLALEEITYHYVPRAAESGGVPLLPARSSKISNGLCFHADDLARKDRKSLTSEPQRWQDDVRFVGIESVYFLNALMAVDQSVQACELQASDRGRDSSGGPLGSLFSGVLRHKEQTLAPGESVTVRALAYLGPKTPEELAVAGHGLSDAIDSGFFTSIAHGLTALLSWVHGIVGNWGLAIIMLTFLVKLTLYPLTHKQMESMAKMKELKPELDRVNELYADDREKKGAAVMELYRKKGVNPMAGCFPMLLQLPIWFSLYSSLSTNIRLLNAPFALWWNDLSSPDPYFVLPLALGVLMFVQQKLAPPTGTDPMQAKMMLYLMPTMITSFMLFLPAGLCLYMFTNSALSILQQRIIESRLKTVSATASSSATSSPVSSVSNVAELDASAGSKDKSAQKRLRRGRK